MSSIQPQWLIEDAKRAFPQATSVNLTLETETSFDWMKIEKTGDQFTGIGCEHKWRLLIKERANVIDDYSGETLTQLRDRLDPIFAERK